MFSLYKYKIVLREKMITVQQAENHTSWFKKYEASNLCIGWLVLYSVNLSGVI